MVALSSREIVLSRIRKATASVALAPSVLATGYADIARPYTHKGSLSRSSTIKLLLERLRDYDADVVESTPNDLPQTIHSALARSGRHRFVAPANLPGVWMTPDFEWKLDRELPHDEIELADGVVTAAAGAIADSGTIVLHHAANEGRRVLTLLPDWHLCVLFASQVVETLPEYFARVEQPPALVTWISGPSATADIEMTRIKGVHGPRHLNVILVRDEA